MAKKIIRLIEEELREVVSATTQQVLNEMAVPIKTYKARVDNLRLQLVENWCLCRYCQLFNPNSEYFNHWIKELRAHMNNIKSLNLKKGDKLKILTQMLIVDYDFDDVNTIYRIVVGKFGRERISNVNIISRVCGDFANSINDFVKALGMDNIITEDYLMNTFGKE